MISKEYLQNTLRKIGVTRINSITRYDNLPIYVYQSCRPDAMHLCVDSGKGKTAAEAFFRAYYLEQACSVQVKNLAMGLNKHEIDNRKLHISGKT